MDFAEGRRRMVEGQVRTFDVNDSRVLAAMLEVPREHFLPPAQQWLAYADCDVGLGPNRNEPQQRFMLRPMVLAKLMQSAQLAEDSRVLDVGCGTGYSTALLAKMAHQVVGLEQDPSLLERAQQALGALGCTNIDLVKGALSGGAPGQPRFDVIFLNGSSELAPTNLFPQLKEGGRLVGVVGRRPAGKAMLYRFEGGNVTGYPVFDAAAPLLPGYARPVEFVF